MLFLKGKSEKNNISVLVKLKHLKIYILCNALLIFYTMPSYVINSICFKYTVVSN